MDRSLPDSSVVAISQAGIQEWVAISFSPVVVETSSINCPPSYADLASFTTELFVY